MVGPRSPQEEDGSDTWGDDWQNASYDDLPSPTERPQFTIRQPTNHQRTMTENIPRPSSIQSPPRRRSNTVSPNERIALSRPTLTIETGRKPYDRRSTSLGFHGRPERSGSFTQTLKTRASRFLRRQDSHGNLTSLKPIDWSDELDESPWQTESRSPKREAKRLQRMSRLEGKPRGHPCSVHYYR